MTIADMLGQSVVLTLLGMAVVFSFLIIMIFAMNLLNSVLHALKLDKIEPPKAPASAPVKPAVEAVDTGAIVAAIAAALHEKQ